jgi:hypothetical protein
LLLLFVGSFERDLITSFKRLNTFTPEDYDTLVAVIKLFGSIVTTPNILTEVSNLSGELRDQMKNAYYGSFAHSLTLLNETYVRSADVVRTPIFRALGITDAAITLTARKGLLVLTEDLTLYRYLLSNRIDALNFNHLRSWSA